MPAWQICGRISGWLLRRSRQHIAIAVAAALALIAWHGPAAAEPLRGAALIVGNGRYEHIARLANPAEDARAVDELVDGLGFETTGRANRGAAELRRDIDRFVEDAEGADVAFLYYGGHAIEADGENWLVPVDADIGSLEAARATLIPLSSVVERLQAKAQVVIVLLDACRDNPFPAGAMLRADAGAAPAAIAAAGLGEPRGANRLAPAGGGGENLATVIGFAAEKGKVALDGPRGAHSPYVAALLRHLAAGGASFSDVMTMVTEEVYLSTGTRQRPWVNASLRRVLYFGRREALEDADEALLRDARRGLLMTIAATPRDMRGHVEQMAAREDLPLDQLYGILAMLKVDVSAGPAELDRHLRAGAENLKRMMAERAVAPADDAQLAQLGQLADRAERAGTIGLAMQFRARASARADELRTATSRQLQTALERLEDAKRAQLQIAATYAAEGETALLGFAGADAARRFGDAYAVARGLDDRLALHYRIRQADALVDIFNIFDDNFDIDEMDSEQALAVSRDALDIARGIGDPAALADAYTGLGKVYENLSMYVAFDGKFEQENPRAKARAAFEAAASPQLRAAAPLRWAEAQGTLAKFIAGVDATGTEIMEALELLRAALPAVPQASHEWAEIQIEIGSRLLRLARLEGGAERYGQALRALRAGRAADHPTEPDPDADFKIAAALDKLTELTGDPQHARDAAATWRRLFLSTEESDGPGWSATLTAFASSLLRLGLNTGDEAALTEAISLYLTALDRIGADNTHGFDAVQVQTSLGTALRVLAERQGNRTLARRAIAAYEAAAAGDLKSRDPRYWADVQRRRGSALGLLASLQSGAEAVKTRGDAADAYRLALTVYDRTADPQQWAEVQNALGYNLVLAAEAGGGAELLQAAIPVLRDAHQQQTGRGDRIAPYIAGSLCRALLDDGVARRDRAALLEARGLCSDALPRFKASTAEAAIAEATDDLRRVDEALAALD